ncbi:carbohydrate binding domain-containing protein [Ligilactobacillus animalis]|uniref:carbohydrate binding domain-containing protein n=1 Tax=Ligilactobacillus animalis TaxID=1605 RepID=UPI0026DED850|nr:carbohydrate binding domain-containing protein [Ligilactobacillus animalis]MDO5884234.1 carbohydrate binding domain-containing protein [Ligilactobacillus animalis]MDU3187229.1 carbohydrate binding domain-containing protein [Ligilactobacillus animalis]
MQYRIYKDNVKIKETTSRQIEITGLKPKTTYTLGVSAYNGLRESTRATITMTTRGLVMTVDKALPVNSEVELEYVEYPLGSVPIGSEPAGMFGGGNRKKLKARVLSSANGASTLELLQAIEDTKTNLIIDADDPYKFNWVNAGSGGKFNITKDYAELTVTDLTQDRWIGFSMDIIPKTVNVGDSFTVSVPVYIDSSVPCDGGSVCIKEHASNKVAIAQNLPDGPKDKWFNLEFTKTAGVKLTDTTRSFYLFLGRNGSIKVGKPTMYYTNEAQSSFKDNAHLRDIGNGSLAAFDGYKAIYLK